MEARLGAEKAKDAFNGPTVLENEDVHKGSEIKWRALMRLVPVAWLTFLTWLMVVLFVR